MLLNNLCKRSSLLAISFVLLASFISKDLSAQTVPKGLVFNGVSTPAGISPTYAGYRGDMKRLIPGSSFSHFDYIIVTGGNPDLQGKVPSGLPAAAITLPAGDVGSDITIINNYHNNTEYSVFFYRSEGGSPLTNANGGVFELKKNESVRFVMGPDYEWIKIKGVVE